MTVEAGPNIIQDGLVLNLDAANSRSYPGTGTLWSDLSGNNNTGTLVNGPTYSSASNGSIVFDGTNDFIQRTTVSLDSLDLTTAFSISIWVNGLDLPLGAIGSTPYYLITKNLNGGFGDQQYAIAMTSSEVAFVVGGVTRANSFSFLNSQWYNIVSIFYGTSVNTYINGTPLESPFSITTSPSFKPNFSIGRRSNTIDGSGGFLFHKGNISQVSIYNRALTASEVSQNFNALRGRYGI